jgi:hypothetical protein
VDLRARHPQDPLGAVARAIYEALTARDIHYELDKADPGETDTQLIRNPAEIIEGRRGTCLDLAALFCGFCLEHDLIPLLLVLVDDKGYRHALAAISLTHDLRTATDPRRPLYRELAALGNESLFNDGPRFLQAVDARQYLAVECTGLAIWETLKSPGEHPRRGGKLDFDAAVAEARAVLAGNRFRLQFALDIGIARSSWGLPEPPPMTDWEVGRPGRDEAEAIRVYLDWFESEMRPPAWSAADRYVTPGTTAIPAPAGVAQAADSTTAEAMAHDYIRRSLKVLKETFDGGDSLTAPLAAFARKGRRVRSPEALLREKKDPMVLLGEPGSGKTLTLWEIGHAVARRARGSRRPEVPIYVPLRSFEANRRDVEPEDVWDLVVRAIPPDFSEIRKGLSQLNNEGRLTILFDGLNEMPRWPDDAEVYRAKVDALGAFPARRAPRSRVIISCRTNDFSYRLRHRVVALLPFDFDQVREYIRRNIGELVVEGEETRDPGGVAMRLLQPGALGEAATNPLILSLCRLYLDQNHAWPSSRQEVFRFYVEWNARRAIADGRDPRGDVAALVAAWRRFAFALSYESRRSFNEDDPIARSDPEAARVGLERGLLVRDQAAGPQVLMFAHHRLQEFLAAWRIAEDPELREGLPWPLLLPIPRWQEILVDVLSMGGGTVEAAVDHLAASLEGIRAEFAELDRWLKEAEAEVAGREQMLAGLLPEEQRAVRADLDAERAAIRRRRFEAIPAERERRHAELVALAARVVGASAEEAAGRLAPGMVECIRLLSALGRAEVQVQMLRAWADADEACPRDAVQPAIESKILWVRRQALAVLSLSDRPFNLGQELAHDWARGRLLATMATHLRAAAGRRRLGVRFVSACYLAYAASVLGMSVALDWAVARHVGAWPPAVSTAMAVLAAALWTGLARRRGRSDVWRQFAMATGVIAGLVLLASGSAVRGLQWFISGPLLPTYDAATALAAAFAAPLATTVAAQLCFWAGFTAAIVPLCRALGQPAGPCYRVARAAYPPDVEGLAALPLILAALFAIGRLMLGDPITWFNSAIQRRDYRSKCLVLAIVMACRMIESRREGRIRRGSWPGFLASLAITAVLFALALPPEWVDWPQRLNDLVRQNTSRIARWLTLLAIAWAYAGRPLLIAALLLVGLWVLLVGPRVLLFLRRVGLITGSGAMAVLRWAAGETRAYGWLLNPFGRLPADVSSPERWAEAFRAARPIGQVRLLQALRGRIDNPAARPAAQWTPSVLLETLDAVEAAVEDPRVTEPYHLLRNELIQMTRQEQ